MRFNQVIVFLMVIAALSAFVMPPGLNAFRKFDSLLAPVSYPVRKVAQTLHARAGGASARPTPSDEKSGDVSVEQLRYENKNLLIRVNELTEQNQKLLELLNQVKGFELPMSALMIAPVIGGDQGSEQVLKVQVRSTEGLTPNMPVLSSQGQLVGKLQIVGIGATRVRLVSDKASTVTCGFQRYRRDDASFMMLPQAPKAVQGTGGDGKMIVRAMKRDEARPQAHPEQGLEVGDWVVVKDRDLPAEVQGRKIGEIEAIETSRNALFSNVVIRPDSDLMKLREVMIVVRK
jgi:cell shape-determining protein MreC